MARIALTDEFGCATGAWFDPARALFTMDESEDFDGRNHISRVTGGQWEHERLYQTASGRWVLHHWSNWQGSRATFSEIGAAEAAAWLIKDGDELPECLMAYAAQSEI